MPASPQPPIAGPSASSDTLFKRMFVMLTALSLAAAYGWLAGFVRQPNGDFSFHWRWLVLLWAFIGLASTIYFWRKIWPPHDLPTTRIGIVKGTLVLLLPGLWWLVLPLRSLSGQHFWDVIKGLIAAIIVLSFGAWMIFRLGKAFEDNGSNDKK